MARREGDAGHGMKGVATGGFNSVTWEEGKMTGICLRSVLGALVMHKVYVDM